MAGIFYPIGTKVRLASGSVDMLVVDVIPDRGEAVCAWTWEGQVSEYTLPTVCLDLVRVHHVIDDREAP